MSTEVGGNIPGQILKNAYIILNDTADIASSLCDAVSQLESLQSQSAHDKSKFVYIMTIYIRIKNDHFHSVSESRQSNIKVIEHIESALAAFTRQVNSAIQSSFINYFKVKQLSGSKQKLGETIMIFFLVF